MSAGKRSDPAKLRREAAKIRQDLQKQAEAELERIEQRKHVDNRRPPKVSPPAERTHQPGWKRRKPIIKGGAVIGRRTGGGNTA